MGGHREASAEASASGTVMTDAEGRQGRTGKRLHGAMLQSTPLEKLASAGPESCAAFSASAPRENATWKNFLERRSARAQLEDENEIDAATGMGEQLRVLERINKITKLYCPKLSHTTAYFWKSAHLAGPTASSLAM